MRKISTKIILMTTVVAMLSVVIAGGIFYYNLDNQAEDNNLRFSQILHEDYDKMIKHEVESAVSALDAIYNQYLRGEMTLEEAKQIGENVLREMRYGENGYFWADTLEGVNVVLLGNETEGTNRMNFQDVNGQYIIKAFINKAQQGGGYLDYYFPKPGEEEASLKRGYTQMFEPFGWVVGTGNYIDDLDLLTNAFVEENTKRMQDAFIVLLLSAVGILILAGTAASILGRRIAKPITVLKEKTLEIAKGHTNVDIDIQTKDEVFELSIALKEMVENIKEQALVAQEIAGGNFDVEVSVRSEDDILNISIQKMKNTISTTMTKINELIIDIENGKFVQDETDDHFEGGWDEIVTGINHIIKTFVSYLDSLPVIVMSVDNEFNIEYLNKTGRDMFEVDMKSIYGKKCYDYFETDDCNTENCMCNRAMKDNKVSSGENVCRMGSEPMYISYSGVPMKSSSGEITGALEIVMDQTQIKLGQITAKKQADFQTVEVKKLIENLEQLAKGHLDIHTSVAQSDTDTEEIAANFRKINNSLEASTSEIRSYIDELSDILSKMAEKDFTASIEREYLGDFIQLKDSINYILKQLNATLSEINASAEQVETGADQVASSSQSLSQGASEQAGSVEEIGATITQVAEQTKENADNASKANDLSTKAKDDAQNGNKQMAEMLDAMNDIKESSKNISKIIKVIDEIAFQTNILALNAAVEAARAGEHGKGFAVVAEEVRNLAARSAQAAKETTELIDNSINKVDEGYTMANETAEALNQIVEGITNAVEIVGMIAEASGQQTNAMKEINQGVEQISQVTQSNTATAEESASASEEMAGQAQMLKSLIQEFKLKGQIKKLESTRNSRKLSEKQRRKEDLEISLDDDGFGKY